MTAARSFRCQPEAVPEVRRFVRTLLRDQPPEVSEAAELLTSELATNCIQHAHSDFEVVVRLGANIRIETHDGGAGLPRLLSPGNEDLTGRGLRIVDAVSEAWGIDRAATSKTVWFTLAPSQRSD